MGAGNSTNENKKFYSLKAKVDETNDPHFALTQKVNGKWETTGKFNLMSGMLDNAVLKAKEYEGDKFNTFVFTFNDGVEISQVEFTHNSITHSFLNTLASDCNKLSTYNLSVYKKPSEKNGKKYWNGGIGVKLTGASENMKWHIDPQAAPKKVAVMAGDKPVIVKGKQIYDDTELRKFWEDIFVSKIQNVLNVPTAKPAVTSEASNITSTNDDNDDLPF